MKGQFPQLLQELRQSKGISQARLALDLNYTQSNISGTVDEFKKVDRKLAEEFAAMFFGRKIEMVNTPLDEFTFPCGS